MDGCLGCICGNVRTSLVYVFHALILPSLQLGPQAPEAII